MYFFFHCNSRLAETLLYCGKNPESGESYRGLIGNDFSYNVLSLLRNYGGEARIFRGVCTKDQLKRALEACPKEILIFGGSEMPFGTN